MLWLKRKKTFLTKTDRNVLIGGLVLFIWQYLSTDKSEHLLPVICYQGLHQPTSNYSPNLPADYIAQEEISEGSASLPDFSLNTVNLHFLLTYCTIKTDTRNLLFLAICLIHLQQCQTWCNTTLNQVSIMYVILGLLNSAAEVSRSKSSQILSHWFQWNWPLAAMRRTGFCEKHGHQYPFRTAGAHGTAQSMPSDAINKSAGFTPLVKENSSPIQRCCF